MTLEQSVKTEIKEAVEQSLEDDKGFEEAEEKQAESTSEETVEKEKVEDESPPEVASEEDSEQGKDEGVAGEVDGNENVGIIPAAGEGKGREPGEAETTPGSNEVPVISEGALEFAIRSGFTTAEANSFSNEHTLLTAVQIINKKTPVGVAEKEHVEEKLLLSDLPDLDPEQYEPEAIETFKKMKVAIQEQQKAIEQLTQETQSSQANQAAQNEREITAWFDQKVAGLGEGYENTLGKGSHGSLNRGSSQFAKREEIADHINLMAAGYSSTGREQPPLDTLFDQAAKFVLQDETNGLNEKKLSDRLSKRSAQHINRAGSEKVKTLETAESSEAELASMIEKKFFKK